MPVWGLLLGVAGPAALTAVLTVFVHPQSEDLVFLYLALVAVQALTFGLAPALVAAAVSFLAVDYFFVPPVHTLTIADERDLVDLLVFFGTAALVGGLASRRRRAQLAAEALSRHLRETNLELDRLYREQERAARTAVRLAQVQQQVSGLQQADSLRRELLQNVSHELRTPLGTILTGSTAMLARTDLSEPVRKDLEIIVAQTRRLNRLVGDMLDMARIEGHAVELHLEPVDMRDALEAAAERLKRLRPERQVIIEAPDGAVTVLADWDRLGQVLDNLLANADRFSPASSPIELSAVAGARGTVVTRVADHGTGVPAELQPHVFERFVSGAQDGGSGTGLGLAIVRGLVEAHAGRVWLEDSEPGQGAVFAFALPAAAVGSSAPA